MRRWKLWIVLAVVAVILIIAVFPWLTPRPLFHNKLLGWSDIYSDRRGRLVMADFRWHMLAVFVPKEDAKDGCGYDLAYTRDSATINYSRTVDTGTAINFVAEPARVIRGRTNCLLVSFYGGREEVYPLKPGMDVKAEYEHLIAPDRNPHDFLADLRKDGWLPANFVVPTQPTSQPAAPLVATTQPTSPAPASGP